MTTRIARSDFRGVFSNTKSPFGSEKYQARRKIWVSGSSGWKAGGGSRGFALPEVLVVVLVSSIILGVIASSIRAIMLHSVSLSQHATMTAQGKKTLAFFTDDVRVAKDILVLKANRLVLDISLVSGVSDLVQYEYDSIKQTFTRTIYYNTTSEQEILLMDGLVSLTISYLTILGDTTTKAIEAKKIKFTAELTRGSNGEIELNRQIATQVVMRNRIMSN